MKNQFLKTISHERKTKETHIKVLFSPFGKGQASIQTGIGFLDHMLHLLTLHANFDLSIEASGDYEVDYHHTVEDIGIVLGEALYKALGERKGLSRYGTVILPMEESLAQAAVDLALRPCFVFKGKFPTEKIGSFDTELIPEFYKALAMNGKFTLHINLLYGQNSHHLAEASFKALGHAFRKALLPIEEDKILSSKGQL